MVMLTLVEPPPPLPLSLHPPSEKTATTSMAKRLSCQIMMMAPR
jgi:hypothetical protein